MTGMFDDIAAVDEEQDEVNQRYDTTNGGNAIGTEGILELTKHAGGEAEKRAVDSDERPKLCALANDGLTAELARAIEPHAAPSPAPILPLRYFGKEIRVPNDWIEGSVAAEAV